MKPKHDDVTVRLTGRDGNAFTVMAAVMTALRKAGVEKSDIDEYRSKAMSGDYDNLLRVTMETVHVE